MASTSWVVAQSQQALKQRLNSHPQHTFKNNLNRKEILTRKLRFIKPTRQQNTRPMTSESMSSTTSPTPPTRQRSDFNPASEQLFDESNIPQLMQWKKSMQSVGCGLRNLGNSCFMNATLQCLCYTPPFINYINTKHHNKKCKTIGYCIFCELQKLIPEMLESPSTAIPRNIFKNLRLLSKKLRPGRQEDAQEFLRFLMEGLHNSCLKQEGRKIKDMRIQETTLIHKIWGGYLRSQIKCCKCGYESNTYDSILDISLEIKGTSVNSALKHFTDPEILDDDNKYFCDNCKKKRRAIKQFTIFEPPNILIVHLKRFENSSGHGLFSGGKINNHIKFDNYLDITQYMSYNICPKVSYSLFGVLIHYGYSSHGGHYVSYIKSSNGQWYLMDDARCQMVNFINVLKEKAYLLFYKRNEKKVLYKSPNISPKLMNKCKLKQNKSISSFDSLQQLADLLPQTASMFNKITHKSDISTPNAKSLIKSNRSISMDTNSEEDIDMDKPSNDVLEWQQNSCGEKRKCLLDNKDSPTKKRKLNHNKKLKLLKRKIPLSKSKSISYSSSPSYNNNIFYSSRKSNTLKLAAKCTLNNTSQIHPKIHKPWNRNRKLYRRATQIPTPQITLHKFKHGIYSDSSSESVLSENNKTESSLSISPINTINTRLPLHDGSSPHTSMIKDENIIHKYLNNSDCMSAIGISNIDSWNNNENNNENNNIRNKIIQISNKPIVEPKDEWDMLLDGGIAYPHKSKVKNNPFKNYKDKYNNMFQTKQNNIQNGYDKVQKNKKKKGNFHNKNRYHNRIKNNEIKA